MMKRYVEKSLVIAILFFFLGAGNRLSAQLMEKPAGYAFEQTGFLDIGSALACDNNRHRLAIADKGRDLIYIFDLNDQTWQSIGDNQALVEPISLSFSIAGDLYVLVKDSQALIYRIGNDFSETLDLSQVDPERSIQPTRITLSPDNKIYLAEREKSVIYVLDETGRPLQKIKSNLKRPDGILIRKSGELVVADKGIDPVLIFSPQGEFIRRLSRPEAPTAQFSFSASGLAQDQRGWIYTLDVTRSQVVWYDPTGYSQNQWAPAPPFFPIDIAIDKFDNIYILESGSGRVMIFTGSQ